MKRDERGAVGWEEGVSCWTVIMSAIVCDCVIVLFEEEQSV